MTPADGAGGDNLEETIILDETSFGPFQVKVMTGSSTFLIDEPIGSGGLGSGPNPYDLLSAAIGSCSLMNMRLYANNMNWPLDSIRIKVTHRREARQARDSFRQEIQLIGKLNDMQKAKILEKSTCGPVYKTLERGSDIQTVLVSRESVEDEAITRCMHMRHLTQACEE